MRKIISILFVFCFSLLSLSQTYYFEGYSVQNGLPQSNISAIVQDKDGYYWLGTESGVSKFDGKNFFNYTTQDGLADNNVTSLAFDANNNLWIGHNNGELTKYDGKTFEAKKIKALPDDKKIYSIYLDKKHQLWIGSNNGAILIKNPNGNLNDNANVISYAAKEGLSPIVFYIQENNSGEIFFLTDIGIKQIEKSTSNFSFVSFPGMPASQITSFLITKRNDFILGTAKGSIYKIITANSKTELLFDLKSTNNIGSFASNFIYTIFEDSNENIWASIYNSGVCKINLNNSPILFNINNGLPVNKIKSIAEDREGHILLGTIGEGLQVFKSERFVSFSKNNGLLNSQIHGICQDDEQNYWFATNEGVTIFYPNEIPEKQIVNIPNINGSPVNNTRSITKDNKGNMYVACWGGRVVKYNKQTKNFEGIPVLYESVNPLVSCLKIDHNNKLWIGSVDGITCFDIENNTTQSLRTVNGLSGNDITCLFEDSKNRMWVGTKQKGITIINNDSYTILNKENGLRNTNITSISEDKSGVIWIGTEGGGIFKYHNSSFENITKTQGLISNYITLVKSDSNNNIWVGTNKGICKINPETGIITPYSKSDGFTGIETKLNSIFIDHNNAIWFGTVNGAIKYSPNYDNSISLEPPLHFTNIQVNLKPIDFVNNISLSYKENSISFEYIAISLSNPEEIKYKIKLEGFDEEWRPSTKENSITFSNLQPGNYNFKIIACINETNCSKEGLNFQFTILPPFWKTWWFYALVIGFGVGSVLLYVKIRERSLIREKKILEETVEQRTIEVVQKNKELDEKNKDITASIRYAKRIQDAILPPDEFVKTYLPKTFILFKPKDIVSGDFYWLDDKKDMVLFAAVDCTGHGVPGAFMSIVGHSKLDQIVGEHGITTPSEILDELNKSVSETLRQSNSEDNVVKDGMDIALCAFNRKTNVMQFAGAYNPLWLIRNGELIEFKGDKFPIGNLKAGEKKKFTNHSIPLQEGDTLYIYSDGFADQFGGANGKKFKYSAFKKLLLDNQHLSMEEQGVLLEKTIESWRGTLEQVDDILVIGTRL